MKSSSSILFLILMRCFFCTEVNLRVIINLLKYVQYNFLFWDIHIRQKIKYMDE